MSAFNIFNILLNPFSFRMLSSNKPLLAGPTYIIEFCNSPSVVPRPTSVEMHFLTTYPRCIDLG